MKKVMAQPTAGHSKAMREQGDSFQQFTRNGVWGTCGDCPRDTSGKAYPEFCDNAGRSDHRLGLDDLVGAYRAHGGTS